MLVKIRYFPHISAYTSYKGLSVAVKRGCDRLRRERSKRVNRNSWYDLKQESEVKRLLNSEKYPGVNYQYSYQVQTCSTSFCNDRAGFDINLCDDVGVGALRARISSAQTLVPSAFSYYLAIVFGYCPVFELYGNN